MSYAGMGQAKWIPGQISFMTAPTGRLPSVQPLIEAGLPYAPYIEHGSWAGGQPDIARYGRDPYRGLGTGPAAAQVPAPDVDRMAEETSQVLQEAIRSSVPPMLMIGVGAAAGGAAGAIGGILGKGLWGGLLGALGGGAVGYLASRVTRSVGGAEAPHRQGTAGLGGVLAVM